MEPKEPAKEKNADSSKILDMDENATILTKYPNEIIDLPKLSLKKVMTNTDIILSIIEICTYNRKYNYDCSNNTKAFWDRVAAEGILKKIFKNFKSETLRRYWKVIRQSENTLKFLEVVKQNQNFINNPNFKLMTLVNAIAYFIQTTETDFESFFAVFNAKDKKYLAQKDELPKSPINLIAKKRGASKNKNKKKEEKNDINFEIENKAIKQPKKDKEEKEKDIKNETNKDKEKEKKIDFEESINDIMAKTKFSRDEISLALFGTSGNATNAILYLIDKEKNDKYFFNENDDKIIKNMRDTDEYNKLIERKGRELVVEREKFFEIK